ncbi:phosphonate ABC transporter ATP-binding protein [Marinobacter sp. SS21]|uniref:phosphonate ABC transporter ATP-binding protein n=1 Tax=Marinobacter sp. SS21 TaxID=2979460 RepID=UPI00232F1AC8|nr:ATP-binding cassette domain-containing protein [Marinobacter sp. SS21]MDC0664308.1 ATP-binding cassette domain-containing protein [Marinobacter sp. SS21]
MSFIQLDRVSASFQGQKVLGPLSLTVAPGERVALVGKSGAGKSTLIKLAFDRAREQASTSLIPQDLGLVGALPVFHNVFMGRLDQHRSWYSAVTLFRPFQRDRTEISALLSQLGMAHKQWAPVASLSGGQRQRTAIARAMYQRSETLLADEPVSALDGPLANEVMALLRERFSTSLIALHDVTLALRYCDRVVGIADGAVVLDQPTTKLSEHDLLPLY